ncbi:MAG: hypothetical protein HDS59_08335 [Barnesiella sp.]|nr:hypothetical protein [Barnesiella sp.]
MKTLKEQVNEIKSATISRNAKKSALAKLGITPYEISLMLESEPTAATARTAFTFGVEIECNVARGSIREAASVTGMNYEYEGYNHRDGHSYFKFTTDGSVTGSNPIECVSPVLRGSHGKSSLKCAIDTLNRAGATVNRSCGLHVHIGAQNLTQQQCANVFNNYFYLESLIDSFMAPSRRRDNNPYCRSLADHSALTGCESMADVKTVLDYDRYHKVNPMAYDRHRTIEFRQHQGSTDYKKILNWVMFCGKLVDWSKKNRLTANVTSIDDIPFLTPAEKKFFNNRIATLA